MDGNQYELLTLFADGGLMMYPLVLCSLVAVGVIIAKTYMLYAAHRASRRLLSDTADLLKQGKLAEATRLADETPGPVAAILSSGLRRLAEGGRRERPLKRRFAPRARSSSASSSAGSWSSRRWRTWRRSWASSARSRG